MKRIIVAVLALALSACGAEPSTPFLPPTSVVSPPNDSAGFSTPVPVPVDPLTAAITPQVQELAPAATIAVTCSNNLDYKEDVTVADYSIFTAGQTIDKRWLVSNNGDCNWDARYRLRWISGDPLGAATDQPLIPAAAGADAIIRMEFTAPFYPGEYTSEWKAIAPDGSEFGESFFIKIVVQ